MVIRTMVKTKDALHYEEQNLKAILEPCRVGMGHCFIGILLGCYFFRDRQRAVPLSERASGRGVS